MDSILCLLNALEYPMAGAFELSSRSDLLRLIIWLEDRKIRHLEIDERSGLRNESSQWDVAFSFYLEEKLGCPHSWSEDSKVDCIIWLLGYAISVEYEDCADICLNSEAERMAKDPANMVVEECTISPPNNQGLTTEQVESLGSMVGLQIKQDEHLIEFLRRISDAVRLLMSARNCESSAHRPPLREFPLGFETKDKAVNEVALVLKMLYLADFREIQNDMNALIVLGQEYTANPKTNTALGKVGR